MGLPETKLGLHTLLVSDVWESTRTAAAQESMMLQALATDLQRLERLAIDYRGEVLQGTGDGLILRFPSAAHGLLCALDFQQLSGDRLLRHRLGLHCGDGKGEQLLTSELRFITDRLQKLAPPGGICCSGSLFDIIRAGIALPWERATTILWEEEPQPFAYYCGLAPGGEMPALGDRQLRAVVFTAIADYETWMRRDRVQVAAWADEDFQVMRRRYGNLQRRCIKSMGSGLLFTFHSVHQALQWAQKIQQTLQQHHWGEDRPRHLLAIHVGDVTWRGGDIYGHAVNLTARLLGHCPPGGIAISGTAGDLLHPHSLTIAPWQWRSQTVHLKGIDLPQSLLWGEMADLASPPPEAPVPSFILQKQFRQGEDLQRAYDRGQRDFRDLDLQDFSLVGIQLPAIQLTNSRLDRSNLQNANLQDSDLGRARFSEANLAGSNLDRIYGNYTNFQGANLQKASLCQAHLSNANFRGADLRGANFHRAHISPLQIQMGQWDHTTIYPDGHSPKRPFKPLENLRQWLGPS